MPKFFSHIARLKGYYDPKHKAYLNHDTSMDYVQRIVRRFKTKNKLEKPTTLLIDMFDLSSYREANVNKKQVSHIMKAVGKYTSELGKLYNAKYGVDELDKNETCEDRYMRRQLLEEELVDSVGQYRIGYSTMIFLIKSLEHKDKRKYRNVVLSLLFTSCRQSFIDAVKATKQQLDYLTENGTDVFLFDIGLKITNFGQNSTDEEQETA